MNAAQAAKAITSIVEGAGTKAYRARKLFELGCDRSEVKELLDMSYSQAHSIWKERDGVSALDGRQSARVPKVWDDHEGDSRVDEPAVGSSLLRQAKAGRRRSSLRLSPTQTRFITQDGHVVVRVDKTDGAFCKKCDRRVIFTLVYLGFVHIDSTSEPTKIEDRYE